MTSEEILDGNKLIAEFMGAVTHKTAPVIISPYIKNDEVWYGDNTIPNEQRESSFRISELKYHSSWDWLMPVVEKIENVLDGDVSISIKDDSCNINSNYYGISVEGYTKIESVWIACVKFITCYNLKTDKK